MQIEIALLISGFAMAFGIYFGVVGTRRNLKNDERKDSAQMTTVIVKLEGISEGIAEIKTDMLNVKGDIKELTERLIIAEQEVKLANKRLDEFEERK